MAASLVAMSSPIGIAPSAGTATAIGLLPTTRSAPPGAGISGRVLHMTMPMQSAWSPVPRSGAPCRNENRVARPRPRCRNARPLDGAFHRLSADEMAEGVACVEHDGALPVGDDVRALARRHRAVAQAFDVHVGQHHPVDGTPSRSASTRPPATVARLGATVRPPRRGGRPKPATRSQKPKLAPSAHANSTFCAARLIFSVKLPSFISQGRCRIRARRRDASGRRRRWRAPPGGIRRAARSGRGRSIPARPRPTTGRRRQ